MNSYISMLTIDIVGPDKTNVMLYHIFTDVIFHFCFLRWTIFVLFLCSLIRTSLPPSLYACIVVFELFLPAV